MVDWIMANEPLVRLSAFAVVFAVMAGWEMMRPRRELSVSKGHRWFTNLTIVVIDTAILRVIFPLAAVGLAWMGAARGWGLLNNIAMPVGLSVALGVVLLDLAIYLQHLLFHAVPVLWRLHRVHHVDRDFDVTTALRFHPVEILLSMLIKFAAVAAIGPSALTVLLFEVILNATAMFNHANVRLPESVDRILRLLIVTPDMHRVHHSTRFSEHNRNFGFNLPWWDRMMGTYRAQPRGGHLAMRIGLAEYRDSKPTHLGWLLLYPFLPGGTGSTLTGKKDAKE